MQDSNQSVRKDVQVGVIWRNNRKCWDYLGYQVVLSVWGQLWWEIKLKMWIKANFSVSQFIFDFSKRQFIVSICFNLSKCDLPLRTVEGSLILTMGDPKLKCKLILFYAVTFYIFYWGCPASHQKQLINYVKSLTKSVDTSVILRKTLVNWQNFYISGLSFGIIQPALRHHSHCKNCFIVTRVININPILWVRKYIVRQRL